MCTNLGITVACFEVHFHAPPLLLDRHEGGFQGMTSYDKISS